MSGLLLILGPVRLPAVIEHDPMQSRGDLAGERSIGAEEVLEGQQAATVARSRRGDAGARGTGTTTW
jgi:hypothetical protein